jgi:hypothetical protein
MDVAARFPRMLPFSWSGSGSGGLAVLVALLSAPAPAAEEAPAVSAAEVRRVLADAEPFLLEGLVPGLLSLEPDRARALLRDGNRQPFAALGQSSGGRVLALAHDAFLAAPALEGRPGARRLLENGLRWAGKAERPAVGLAPGLEPLRDRLRQGGAFPAEIVPMEALERQVDVYVFVGQRTEPGEAADRLRKFLLKGGGVMVAATPWAFAARYPDFHRFPANEVAELAGIRFLAEGTAAVDGPVRTQVPDPGEVTAALRNLAGAVGTEAETAARSAHLESLRAVPWLDPEDWAPVLDAVVALDAALGPVVPSRSAPVSPTRDPLRHAVVEVRSALNQSLPAELVPALPAAADFPGPVPAEAPRVTREVRIDGTWRGWKEGRGAGAWAAGEIRPTGLYAAPGEVIRVEVPPEAAGAGWEIVLGSYGGGLRNRAEWHRYPRLQRSFPVAGEVTAAANGLGGLVGIRIPRGGKLGTVGITVHGAVDAPWFVLGETDPARWRTEVRQAPGPWAELEGRRVILAVPSGPVRALDDPEALLRAWDEILDRAAWLAGVDREESRKERIVFDRQTSAGSLHSGYPIAAHLGADLDRALDVARLRGEGSWGFFHEIGHNHQHDLWFLPGTGETTCNLWSVHLFEAWVGKSRDGAHPGVHPLRRRQLRQEYFAKGREFARDWNVFTALDAYLLVQERFGWEPFREVFALYDGLPEVERPRTQAEKNDQWVLRLSRACGHNLAPYHRAWNLPLGADVDRALQDLPVWMPDPPLPEAGGGGR